MKIIKQSTQTARKQHKCNWCELAINKGEKYESSVNINDGIIFTWKNHISCSEIASKLKMWDGVWNEGLTAEDFQECIKEEYQNITSLKYPETYASEEFEDQLGIVKNYHLTN